MKIKLINLSTFLLVLVAVQSLLCPTEQEAIEYFIKNANRDEAVKQAYKRLALNLHPDTHPELGRAPFQELVAAYEALKERFGESKVKDLPAPINFYTTARPQPPTSEPSGYQYRRPYFRPQERPFPPSPPKYSTPRFWAQFNAAKRANDQQTSPPEEEKEQQKFFRRRHFPSAQSAQATSFMPRGARAPAGWRRADTAQRPTGQWWSDPGAQEYLKAQQAKAAAKRAGQREQDSSSAQSEADVKKPAAQMPQAQSSGAASWQPPISRAQVDAIRKAWSSSPDFKRTGQTDLPPVISLDALLRQQR